MSNKKWKDKLLSSSLPLEYEVSKILTELKFSTRYDYPYYRIDKGYSKEFSVGILSSKYLMQNDVAPLLGTTELFIECKYRDPNKKWVFLPENNSPELSELTIGYTIRNLQAFSKIRIENENLYKLESSCDFGLKGTEINPNSGEVFDKDIIHGISQLKYGLPYLIKQHVLMNLGNFREDISSDFIIPILVTNADLYLLDENFGIDKVKNSNNIEDLGKEVPYLILQSQPGPDFQEHHRHIFSELENINKNQTNINFLEEIQEQFKHETLGIYESPKRIFQDLIDSDIYTLKRYYSQYFVCSLKNFKKLVADLVTVIENEVKKASY